MESYQTAGSLRTLRYYSNDTLDQGNLMPNTLSFINKSISGNRHNNFDINFVDSKPKLYFNNFEQNTWIDYTLPHWNESNIGSNLEHKEYILATTEDIPDITSLATKEEVTAVANDLSNHTSNDTIHVTASDKETWSNKVNQEQIADMATKTELNDYATKVELGDYELKSDAFSGDYNDLTNKPTIPTKTSELTNDSDFITSSALNGLATETYANNAANNAVNSLYQTLAQVAKTGSYSDLSNKPDLTVYELKSEAFSGNYEDLTNKPDLSVYELKSEAFSGDYNDLTNKPTIPVVDYPVTSVNSKTGDVVLAAADINAKDNNTIQANIDRIDNNISDVNNALNEEITTRSNEIARVEGLIPDISGKLDKVTNKTTAAQVYYKTAAGTNKMLDCNTTAAEYQSIMMRDATGHCKIVDPVNGPDIANKKYVDEGLDNKLDKVTTTSDYARLYGVMAQGVQNTYKLTSNNVPNTIVSRDGAGQINVAYPTDNENAANKKYVDDNIPDTSNMVTTDTAQTIQGHKIFYEGLLDVASEGNTGNAIRLYNAGIGIYDKGTNNQRKAYLTLPRTNGTLALTSDIPTDYVSTSGDQTINGKKPFNGGVTAANFTAQGSNQSTIYGGTQMVHTFADNTKLNLQYPSKSGNKTIATVDDIYYQNGDKFVNTSFYSANGYLTGGGKEIGFTIILPKNLKNIKTITVNKLSCNVRGIGGYLNGSGYIDYITQTGITVTVNKTTDNAVFIQIKMSDKT